LLPINPIPYQKLELPLLQQKGISITIKRLDLVHEAVSGNKFFKLKYNLASAVAEGYTKILTFGGAYSNHIAATAAAAKVLGLAAVGVIRGEAILPLNHTLAHATDSGMELFYLDRSQYRLKNTPDVISLLKEKFGPCYIIPEGGTNVLAVEGTKEILTAEDSHYTDVIVPIGTGGTFIGMVASLLQNQKLIGVSALKGDFIHEDIASKMQKFKIEPKGTFSIADQYHFGGYAKSTPQLISFITDFHANTGIPLDPIYTGKMMYAVFDLIEKDVFDPGAKILAIHTGGLQGIIGFNQSFGTNLSQ
jgi:1-aminocyclopropane-1-carboxylate deaminase